MADGETLPQMIGKDKTISPKTEGKIGEEKRKNST